MQFKIKPLYLSAYNTPEAGNRVLLVWIKWLQEHGHKVFLAYPGGGWMNEKICNFKEFSTIECDFSYPGPKDIPQFLSTVLRLFRYIKRFRIQIIHCNSEVAYRYGVFAARLCRIPIVTHFRFHFPEEYYKWSFKGKRCPAGVFYVSSPFYAEEIPKLSCVAPYAKSWVLHNCIEAEQYNRISLSHDLKGRNSPFTVVYPAAVQELKNQLHLFEIDRVLRKRGLDVQFVSAGRVKESVYWEKCQKAQKEYPNNNVKFIGHTDDILSLYSNADLSISLSHYETFGFSVLESMASGVPVVSYAIPALVEVIGDSGITVPLGDVEYFANVIAKLASDAKLRGQLTENAKKRVQEMFSSDVIVPKLLNCYKEVLQPIS